MKLLATFRYELVYQSRNVSTWFYFLLLLVLTFFMAGVVFTDEPLTGGYFSNAPYMIARIGAITFFFLGLLILAPFAGNAATRDLETRMHPLLYSSPVPKQVYLGGRFLAAFALGSIVMTAIPIGIFVASLLPIEHPELIGPTYPVAYISTYFLLILPNTFIVVAFMFAAAVLSRKGMISYLIAVILGVMAISSWQFLGVQQGNWTIASFADPLELSIMMQLKKLWTANQKNTLFPGMDTSALLNRVLWLALSAVILIVTYLKFKTSTISWTNKKSATKPGDSDTSAIGNYESNQAAELTIPHVPKSFDLLTRLLQVSAIAKESFKLIATGWGWMALICMFLFVVLSGSMWFSDYHDIPEFPVTGNLLGTLENVKDHGVWFIIPLLIIYYAGELVWRERDSRLNDIIGAAPVPVWISFSGKFAGMLTALLVAQVSMMIAGILLQVSLGYYNFQIGVYLKVLLGLRFVDYILFAVLAFAVHVILNQKYLAYFICVLVYLFSVFGPEFGIESGLPLYASDPGWSYSDLRALSPFMLPWLYFKIYWTAWAMFLVVVATVLWPRGSEKGFKKRFQQGIRKNNRKVEALGGFSLLLIIVSGGIIFYNTHFLYPETAPLQTVEWKADYEKRFGKYSKRPQPAPVKLKLKTEIYPGEGSADFVGTYHFVNKTTVAIDSLFMSTTPGIENHQLSWSRAVKSQVINDDLDFNIYTLETPLLPEDSIQLEFHVSYNPKGFPNNGMNTVIVKNGTYFDDTWLPAIGYQDGREIFDANDRKEQDLEPKSFLEPEVESYIQQRISLEAIVGTDAGQVAVTQGKLLGSWTEKGRSYFQYATENPVNNKFGFFSSDYELYKAVSTPDSTKAVDIRILHHPSHTHNLETIVNGVQASLKYMTRELGRYPNSEVSFTEVPGYNKGMYAYPTNIFYREGVALLKPSEDPRGIDIVFATVAHEMSHQWWGAQVSPAPTKGAALITESLAWFSAFEILEEAWGKEVFLRFVDMARDEYFSPQERAADPLLQASQTSLIYRKGPLALYALSEYIGKEHMRKGLLHFFNKYNSTDSVRPFPSDLYHELQNATPDSLKYLLHDLFAANTFWELKTEKVTAARMESGKWKVELDVFARKFTVDQSGTESDVDMKDWIQIGMYSDVKTEKLQEPLYLQQHRIHSGKQTINIELEQKPRFGGIDPDWLLMDLKRSDNVVDVDVE